MKKCAFCIIATAFLFGTLEVSVKYSGVSFDSIQLTFLRFLIGGLLLLPFSIADLKKRGYRLTPGDLGYLLFLGVTCVCLSMALLQLSIEGINANLAAVIICTSPLFTMIFAHFVADDPFTRRKALVLALMLVGLVIVADPRKVLSGAVSPLHLLYAVLSSMIFGLYTAYGKRRIAKIGGMTQNAMSFLFGCGVLLIFMLLAGKPVIRGISLQTLPILLYLGIFVTGLGYYEAFINGERVGDQVLDPGWTYYNKHTSYEAFDVLPMLKSGKNAIGMMIGRGQYNPLSNDIWRLCKSEWVGQPKAIALLRIEYSDGSVSTVGTDGSWRTTGGPIIYDDTRLGEIYDARLEHEGWATADYDDSAWKPVAEVDWKTSLKFQCQPPVRCFEGLKPVKSLRRSPTETVYDMGRNLAGWARVKVKGKAGQRVLVEYCEIVNDTLLVPWLPEYRRNCARPADEYASFYDSQIRVRQQNGYILKGDSEGECFECHFSYKGFQYVRVTADADVEVLGVESIPVHSDLRSTGSFECSDPSINLLQRNSINSMLSNYMSIPTDCPHREKQGWTADAFIASEAAMYNFDMANFYSNWLRCLVDSESPDGSLPTVAPSTNYDINSSTTWPSALVRVAGDLYRHYSEARPSKDYLDCMKRFIFNSSRRTAKGNPYIINDVLGDWVSPYYDTLAFSMVPPEGTAYYGTATHAYCLSAIAEIARLAGDDAAADSLLLCAEDFRKGFNREYYNEESAAYRGTVPTPDYRQAASAVALEYGLVAEGQEERVREGLVADLKAHDYRIGTGFLGTPAIMNYLPLHDPETAFKVATQTEYPGFTYMLRDGSTTIWENWSGQDSRNHLPFVLISAYYYKFLAGIRAEEPGFASFTVAPTAVEHLDWVKAHHDSVYGRIASEWRRNGNHFTLTVTVPANTRCTVVLPSRNGDEVHHVGSGRYTFNSEL